MRASWLSYTANATRVLGEETNTHSSNISEGQMVTGFKWTYRMWSHTKRHFHSHLDILGEAEWELPGETLVMLNKDMLRETQRYRYLLDRISSCLKHAEGVTWVALLRLKRRLGVGASHHFCPLPGSTAHYRRCKAMRLTTMSSKDAFLLTALLERNHATPVRFWGSKSLFISAFSADHQTHTCLPLQGNHGPSLPPRFCLFSPSGGSFRVLGTPSSQKNTFWCAFLLLHIILRFEIHLVRNMQHYQLVIITA